MVRLERREYRERELNRRHVPRQTTRHFVSSALIDLGGALAGAVIGGRSRPPPHPMSPPSRRRSPAAESSSVTADT